MLPNSECNWLYDFFTSKKKRIGFIISEWLYDFSLVKIIVLAFLLVVSFSLVGNFAFSKLPYQLYVLMFCWLYLLLYDKNVSPIHLRKQVRTGSCILAHHAVGIHLQG